jgi:hypothetical protein
MNPTKLVLLAGAALIACTLALPVAATAAKKPISVHVRADPLVPKVDPDTGDPVKYDPYILFALKGATRGKVYRLVTEQGPKTTAKSRCIARLTSHWEPVFGANGNVAFPLIPVPSGTYSGIGVSAVCRGSYVMNVHESTKTSSSWKTVRAFAFHYPSFRFSYLPIR